MLGCDFIRAICAMGIILFHISCGLSKEAVHPLFLFANGSWGGCLVDIFLILSGAMLYYNHSSIDSLGKFYYKRWKTLYPMYYIAFLHYYLQRVYENGKFFFRGKPQSLILTVLGMDGYFFYKTTSYLIVGEWFLGAIVFLYILYPFLLWMFKHCKEGLLLTVTLLWLWQVYYGNFKIGTEQNLLSCLVCFVAGMYIIKYKLHEKVWLLVISIIASIALCFVRTGINGNITTHFTAVFIFIALFWLGDILANKCKTINNVIGEISSVSYGMFLLQHVIINEVMVGFKPIGRIEVTILCVCIIVLVILYAKVLTIVNKAVMGSSIVKKIEQQFRL